MAKSHTRIPGDVYRITLRDGYSYAVYTHPDPNDAKHCGLLRVSDRIYAQPLECLKTLADDPVQTHYIDIAGATKKRVLHHVGRVELPDHLKQTPVFKHGLPGRPPNYWTCQWTILTYTGDFQRVGRLPVHSVRIPSSGLTGYLLLIDNIENDRSEADWLVPDNIDWTADTGGPLVLDGIAGYATWAEKPCALARVGDLLEIPVRGGYAYGLISHDHSTAPCWGPLLRVFRGVRKRRATSFARLLRGDIQFNAFTLVTEGLRRGMWSLVDNVAVPEPLRMFPPFKRQLRRAKSAGSLEMVHRSWLLWTGAIDSKGDVEFFLLDQLPSEYVNASIKEVMLPEKVITRIESGWMPRDDVDMATVSEGDWRR
jgi:hypothetical protein